MTSLLVCQQLLVPFVRREPDGHLGNDTTQHSSETLVQTERSLLLHDVNTGSDEPAGFRLRKDRQHCQLTEIAMQHSPQEPWPAAKAASGP